MGGTRLDLIASTGHDRFAEQDYLRLRSVGIHTCRDGVRWHLIEKSPGFYDFSSFRPMISAARSTGMQVIWDLLHYGWPDHLDIFRPDFIRSFARFTRAVARVVAQETDGTPWFVVVNEPSFLSWAGGDEGFFPPFVRGRGDELKKQLIRATIAGIEAVRDEVPGARFVQVDPLVNIVTDSSMSFEMQAEANGYCRAQFQAWDMIGGYACPELGGNPSYLDVVGCNYYVHNQWVYGGSFIERSDPRYRPFHSMLAELQSRYNRPILLSETGIESDRRPEWLCYITDELAEAASQGVDVMGACLYPILNHPGWDDDRHCHNGLWDYCNDQGHREIYSPLACELEKQQARIQAIRQSVERSRESAAVLVG